MALEAAAAVLTVAVVATGTEFAAAVAAAGSDPDQCEGTRFVQGSPTHG